MLNTAILTLATALTPLALPLWAQDQPDDDNSSKNKVKSNQPTTDEIRARDEYANVEAQLTAGLQPRPIRPPQGRIADEDMASLNSMQWYQEGILYVKFRDGLHIRIRNGHLSGMGTGVLKGSSKALKLGEWHRLHDVAEDELDNMRSKAMSTLAKVIHDPNLEYLLILAPDADLAESINSLLEFEIVEFVSPLPRPSSPQAGPDNYVCTGGFVTPSCQGYLLEAPDGIGASDVWHLAGGTGGNVSIADIESDFLVTHVELSGRVINDSPFCWGSILDPLFPLIIDHGTATLGMLRGNNNEVGAEKGTSLIIGDE